MSGGIRAEAAWKPAAATRMVVPARPAAPPTSWPACWRPSSAELGPVLRRRQQVGGRRRHRLDRSRQGCPRRADHADGQYRAAVDCLFTLPQHAVHAESLIPVSNVITAPNVLVVHPSVTANKNRARVRRLAQGAERQGLLRLSGTGQSPHLSGAWFLQLTGTKAEHIPYRGAAPALQDLTAGVTQSSSTTSPPASSSCARTSSRGLGITSAQRNPLTPELVTDLRDHAGVETVEVSTWFGVFLPGRTPRPIVDSLNAQMKTWLDDAKTQERFKSMAGFCLRHARAVRHVRQCTDRAVEERDRQGRAEARRQLTCHPSSRSSPHRLFFTWPPILC